MKTHLLAWLIAGAATLATASEQSDALKRKILADTRKLGVEKALKSKSYRHNLAKHRLYQVTECSQFTKFEKSPVGIAFLKKFLSDDVWLEKTLSQGVPVVRNGSPEGKDLNNRYSEAIIRLAIICRKYPVVWKNTKLKEVAAAVAFSTPFRNNDRAFTVRSFGYFYDSIKRKQFIPDFYKYEPWMLRFVLWHGETSYWLQQKYNVPPQQLHGMAWNVSYRLRNIFDDSIHSHTYSEPWDGIFGPFQVATDVGGVCGSISKVGSLTANSHGAPCITMGQPGHCAYAYFNFDDKRWYRGNDVGRPSSPHHVIIENTFHGFSELQLTNDTFQPYNDYIKAARFNWLAHLYDTSGSSLAEKQFATSCKIKPKAYDFRNDYLQFLCRKKKIKKSQIIREFKSAITDFVKYPDQAWQLVSNSQKLLDKLSQDEKYALVKFFHESASKQKLDHHVMYTALITHQFKILNGGRQKVSYLIDELYTAAKTPAKLDLEAVINPKAKK